MTAAPRPWRRLILLAVWLGGLAAAEAVVSGSAADAPPDAKARAARPAATAAPKQEEEPEEIAAPRPSRPELYLSWNAPFGAPGATDHITVTGDDTSRVDTLYLSFDPQSPRVPLLKMDAVLFFHPAPGDTLGAFWHFKRGWENSMNLAIDFDVAAGFPCALPWKVMGFGRVAYDHTGGRGRLDLSFRVDSAYAAYVDARRYCVARVKVKHRRPQLSGRLQPVCVEFASLRLDLASGRDLEVHRGEHRFVSWNDPTGSACEPHRGAGTARPWTPPGFSPATQPPPTPDLPRDGGAPRDTTGPLDSPLPGPGGR